FLQGAFGALTVTMKLFPAIVTLHLLGGLVLLMLLQIQAIRYAQAQSEQSPIPVQNSTRLLIVAALGLLWLQVALGGWVSTNYAVLACTDFPACQNSLWPAMDFRQGFTLWRELGASGNGVPGENISFQALTAIHYLHRLSAYVVFVVLMTLSFRLYRLKALRGQAQWLAGLTLLQVATGLGNVLLGWPLLAAVLHTGGAAALVIVLTSIVFCSRNAFDTVSASKLSASRLSA
ncbi:MAG: COX15/CtaA family protein, partial [Pseudomonadota bacterium]